MRLQKTFLRLLQFALIAAITFGVACRRTSNRGSNASSAGTPTPATDQPGQPLHVSAERLYAEYEADKNAADQKYKDKQLLVTGRVDSPGEEMGDEIMVVLANGKPSSEADVEAYFDPAAKDSLADLERGQKLNLLCRCTGKINGVELKDCSVQPQ